MDRITFESVMEEIKKSLGEARLMKIGEESVADTQAEIQKGIDARNATRDAIKMKSVDDADVARDAKEKTIPAPAPAPVPKSANEPSMTNSVMNAPAAAPAPSSAPAPAATPATTARMAPGAMTGGSFKPEAPKPEPAPIRNIGAAAQVGKGSSTYSTSPLNNTPAKPTTPSAPSTGAGTVAKPAAPKPSAPAGVDTASIYKKHGVGGSDEDAGAFHRAEAEIAAARKATPSAPAAKPSTPSAPSAPRPVSQGSAAPRPASSPLSSLSTSGQAMAKKYSGGVGTDSSGNNPMPAPAPKAAPSTPSTGGVTNTPSTGAIKGDNATQGTSPKGFGSSMTRIPYDPKNPAPSTTTRTPYDPKSSSKSIMRPAAAMQENFDQFVKKFLKESK